MTFEKWKKRNFVHHELERFVDLRVALLQGPLAHLSNQFLSVIIVNDGRVRDFLQSWSLFKCVYWDLIVVVRTLLIKVCI